MASRSEIAAEQKRLKDAGFYRGPVDGLDGQGTRDARDAYRRASETAGAARADADARKADADARAAEAKVKAIEAEANAAKAKTDAENAGVDRATQIAMNVGAAAAGVGIGHKVAAGIEARHNATLAARNAGVKAIGSEARKILAQGVKPGKAGAGQIAKLTGVVAAADKLNLGVIKGPKGLAAAGVLLAEAAISRFVVAPQLENETAREAVNSVATLGVFGATTIIGQRSVANATPPVLPSGKDLSAIETARAVAKEPVAMAAEKMKTPKPVAASKAVAAVANPGVTSTAGKVARVAGAIGRKALTPVFAIVAAAQMFKSSAQAGDSTGLSVAKATGAAIDMAVTGGVATDIYTNPETRARVEGAYQQGKIFNRANRTGNVTTQAGMDPVARGTSAVLGVAGLAFAKGFAAEARKPGVGLVGRAGLRGAAVASGVVGAGLLVNSMSAAAKADDGSAAVQSTGDADSDERHVNAFYGGASLAAASVAMEHARDAKGRLGRFGWRGAAALLTVNAADHAYQAIKGQSSGGQGKAYLNSSAQKKAETAPVSMPVVARAVAAPGRSDGQTNTYTRVDPRTGKSVQVKAYATPKR